jgi:hypothetical protein
MSRDLSSVIAEVEGLAGFQRLIARCPTDSDRKVIIMTARSHGALTDDETALLVTGMMLETA